MTGIMTNAYMPEQLFAMDTSMQDPLMMPMMNPMAHFAQPQVTGIDQPMGSYKERPMNSYIMNSTMAPSSSVMPAMISSNTGTPLIRILEDYEKAKAYLQSYHSSWERYYNLYMGRWTSSRVKTRAKINVPEIFASVETIAPRMLLPLKKKKDALIVAHPRFPFFASNAKTVQDTLNYQFDVGDILGKLEDPYKQAEMFGFGVVQYFWDFKPTVMMSPMGPEINTIGLPNIQGINVFDFFFEPGQCKIEDCAYVIRREVLSKHEVLKRAREGIYQNVQYLGLDDQSSSFSSADPMSIPKKAGVQGVEILNYYTPNEIIVIADSRVELRREPNTYGEIPFIVGRYIRVPFQMIGIGAIQPAASIAEELNLKRSQRIDGVDLSTHGMIAMGLANMGYVNQLTPRPGGVAIVQDINQIKPITFPDATASAFREEGIIKSDIQNATGATELRRGNSDTSGPSMTATEVQVKNDSSVNREELAFQNLAEDFLIKIARAFLRLNKLFGTQIPSRSMGPDQQPLFSLISPMQLIGEFDFILTVDPQRLSTQAKQEKAVNLFNTLVGHPFTNQLYLLLWYLKEFEVENPMQFISAPMMDPMMNPMMNPMEGSQPQMNQQPF